MSGAHAMVLAAGLGLRMRPFTEHAPKPLLPVHGKTLIDRALDWLAASGIEEAVVNSAYKAEMLEAHLLHRKHPALRFSREASPLETGGGIAQALPLLAERFICANSDVICIDGKQPALQRLKAAWDEDVMDALLLLHKVEDAVGYDGAGDFFLLPDGTLRRRVQGDAPYVFTGVQLLHRRLFDHAPGGAFSMNLLYDHGKTDDGRLPRIYGLPHDGAWLHVGDPAGLVQAEAWFAEQP